MNDRALHKTIKRRIGFRLASMSDARSCLLLSEVIGQIVKWMDEDGNALSSAEIYDGIIDTLKAAGVDPFTIAKEILDLEADNVV